MQEYKQRMFKEIMNTFVFFYLLPDVKQILYKMYVLDDTEYAVNKEKTVQV